MFFIKKQIIIIILLLLLLCACTPQNTDYATEKTDEEDTVKIVYVDWATEVASAHVVQAVIEEKLGYSCQLLPVSAVAMWEAVASGDQDAMVAAWLPSLHHHYLDKHKDHVVDLGPNLENVFMGMVVPTYVTIDSVEDLKEYGNQFRERIIGIDPGAGLMTSTDKAIEDYGLKQYELVTGSDATMVETLENAIDDGEWIVVTGWTPHWKFARWDLKYLKDPLGSYGSSERIHTIVREGLEEDMPEVYELLDRFYWEPEHMEHVMLLIHENGVSPEEAARIWISENEEIVNEWILP